MHRCQLATYSQLSRQRNAIYNADGAASSSGLDWSLLLVEWYRVILDESHEVRKWNPKTVGKQVQAVMELQKLHGLCLTGTPMQVRMIRTSIFASYSLTTFVRMLHRICIRSYNF